MRLRFCVWLLGCMCLAPARADMLLDSSALTKETSLAVPGEVPPPLDDKSGLQIASWTVPPAPQSQPAVFTLTFRNPLSGGTVVAYDCGEPAYLADGQWKTLPATPARRLQVIPLPADQRIAAVRFTVPARLSRKFDERGPLYEASLPYVAVLAPRMVNVASDAAVAVSSAAPPSEGFQPQPWLNRPETLVDGFVDSRHNFFTAKRDAEITPDAPEWIVLAWEQKRTIAGLALLRGSAEKGLGAGVLDIYDGDGDARFAAESQWKQTPFKLSPPGPFRSVQYAELAQPVAARGLRLRCVGGVNQIGLGEIAVLAPADKATTAPDQPAGVVPITFEIPAAGKVTIQIRDRAGRVVANPVAGMSFPAGRNTAYWNLDDVVGKPVIAPGEYRWHGLYVPPLRVEYRYSYLPYPLAHVPWQTEDRRGGWLADHEPPRTIARAGNRMWLGAFAEAGDSIVETDADANKLWGIDRIWVAIPAEICIDGDYYYGWCEGGWIKDNQAIIQINTKNKQSRKIFQREMPKADTPLENMRGSELKRGVTGFQVVGNLAFVAFGKLDAIQVFDISKGLAAPPRGFGWDIAYKQFDDQKPVLVREIKLPSPGRLRKYGQDKLITTSGADIVTIDLKSYQVRTLIAGRLKNPLGLGVDDRGNIYVGEGAPLHQVFGYSPDGKLIATLGKPGPRRVGPFDVDDLENPYGVEVGPDGRVWVMEYTEFPKRVSLWDPSTGRCTRAVYGPTQYGGGGCLDPADDNRCFYRGMEFRRDPATGAIRPVNLYYRTDSDRYARFSWADYPEYAFRSEGKLWMTSFMWPHGHPLLVLWLYKDTHVMPVAALGSAVALRETFGEKPGKKGDHKDWADTSSLVKHIPGYQPDQKFFVWTDLNDDGFVQPAELKFGRLEHEGRLLTHAYAGWNWRMNERFEAAANAGNGRMIFFRPTGRTPQGYPTYEVPTATVAGSGEALAVDSAGNAIVLGGPLTCVQPDGTVRWSYRNDWPGLHAGHRTTARGDEPGVLIAPTRIWGIARVNDTLGEIVCFNSNLGCTYLMTTDDGLFIDRIFRDQRVGLLWRMPQPPAPEVLAETSLYDEHFGGTFQKVRCADGRERFYYIVGKNHCTVVQLSGLENIQRLSGGTVMVTAEHVARAQEMRQIAAARKNQPRVYVVERAKAGQINIDGNDREWPEQRIDGFALMWDEQNLYVLYRGRDDRAVFENKGENPLELFKTGDTVDVMLQTRPGLDPARTEAGDGDIRLLFAMFRGTPVCVLYDFRIPGHTGQRVPFSSPWRTVWCDRVAILDSAVVKVSRRGNEFTLEAAVPLKDIHLDPAALRETRGDVGRVYSDQTGSAAASRVYWSNKNTAIMSDLPSEAALQPNLWGLFRFAQ